MRAAGEKSQALEKAVTERSGNSIEADQFARLYHLAEAGDGDSAAALLQQIRDAGSSQ